MGSRIYSIIYDTVTYCGFINGKQNSNCNVIEYDGLHTTCTCSIDGIKSNKDVTTRRSLTENQNQRLLQSSNLLNYQFQSNNTVILGKRETYIGQFYPTTSAPTLVPTHQVTAPPNAARSSNGQQNFIQSVNFYGVLIPISVFFCCALLIFIAYRRYTQRNNLKRYVSHNNFLSREQFESLVAEAKRLHKEGLLEDSEVMYRRAIQVMEMDSKEYSLSIHPSVKIETYTGIAEVLGLLENTIDSIHFYEKAHREFQQNWDILSSSQLGGFSTVEGDGENSTVNSSNHSQTSDSNGSKPLDKNKSRQSDGDDFAGWYSNSETSDQVEDDSSHSSNLTISDDEKNDENEDTLEDIKPSTQFIKSLSPPKRSPKTSPNLSSNSIFVNKSYKQREGDD